MVPSESVREVVVQGIGLHSGVASRVILRARSGPVRLSDGVAEADIADLEVCGTSRATTVEAAGGAIRVGTVEHLFAALCAMRIHEGLLVCVEGPEIPILDGAAAEWCAAIQELDLAPSRAVARIARPAVLEVGPSVYHFAPAAPHLDARGDCATEVEVYVELDDPRLEAEARWDGTPDDFRTRIASARTFALARDLEELARRGLARHVPPTSVVLLAPDAIHSAGRPFSPDEPARHKLLDFLGDLYLRGGAPLGTIRAIRPGHTSNAHALRRAWEEGVLIPVPPQV
jgi:UDP-3-O-[3-hydroxymyristoyl] N-acetylglucosamine deacetylase